MKLPAFRLYKGAPARMLRGPRDFPHVPCEGWIMVRRKGAMPFVVTWNEWSKLPACDKDGRVL